MSDKPLVSVIIPCYKQAEYLPEAVDSALAQILFARRGDRRQRRFARRHRESRPGLRRPNRLCSQTQRRPVGGAQHRHRPRARPLSQVPRFRRLFTSRQIEWQMEALAGREDAASLTATRLFRDGKPEEYLDHVPQADGAAARPVPRSTIGAPDCLAVSRPRLVARGRRLRRIAALRRGLGLLHADRSARRDACWSIRASAATTASGPAR